MQNPTRSRRGLRDELREARRSEWCATSARRAGAAQGDATALGDAAPAVALCAFGVASTPSAPTLLRPSAATSARGAGAPPGDATALGDAAPAVACAPSGSHP